MASRINRAKEYFDRTRGFLKAMRKREKMLQNSHISADGSVHVPIYIKSIAADQSLMVVPDEELDTFLDQVERSLSLYSERLPACVNVYVPDEISEEYKMLFMNGIRKHTHREFIVRKNRLMHAIRFLLFMFIAGMALMVISHRLAAAGVNSTITGTIDIVDTVLIWELADYIIRVGSEDFKKLKRIIQVGTAEIKIRKWD